MWKQAARPLAAGREKSRREEGREDGVRGGGAEKGGWIIMDVCMYGCRFLRPPTAAL